MVWDYPCETFVIVGLGPEKQSQVLRFNGNWAACDRCSNLVEAKDDVGLAKVCAVHNDWTTAAGESLMLLLVRNFMRRRGDRVAFTG